MYEVLSVTAPIYLLIAAGFAATRLGLFERADMRVFGKYVINLAFPALLFNALSQRQVNEVINPLFIGVYLCGSLIVMVAGIVWARRVAGKDMSLSAVMGMGMTCPNSGFIGFPLVAMAVGPNTGAVALALAIIVENFFLIPIALAIAGSGAEQGAQDTRWARWRAAMLQSLQTVVRNPMIHGLALGFLFLLLNWRLPEPLSRAVGMLAASCSAMALLVVGGLAHRPGVSRHLAGYQSDHGRQVAAASAGGAAAGDGAAADAARNADGGGDPGGGAANGDLPYPRPAIRPRWFGRLGAIGDDRGVLRDAQRAPLDPAALKRPASAPGGFHI